MYGNIYLIGKCPNFITFTQPEYSMKTTIATTFVLAATLFTTAAFASDNCKGYEEGTDARDKCEEMFGDPPLPEGERTGCDQFKYGTDSWKQCKITFGDEK